MSINNHDNTELANLTVSPFDAIKQIDENGQERWSARDLQELLGYVEWRKFEDAIERAMISCKISGQDPTCIFVPSDKDTNKGKHGSYTVSDYHLTRHACYLTAMNGDVRKPEIANAQTYFVARTQQAEQIEAQLKSQLGSMQLFEKVFTLLMEEISKKEILENKHLAPHGLFMLRRMRLLFYRAVHEYEALIKHYHSKKYKASMKGSAAQLQIVTINDAVMVNLQFPFVEEMK